MKPPLLVEGMHGMGDCLHQRAILRQLMPHHDVWLETSWASMYWDLVQDGLHLVRKPTSLRTQAKNQIREASAFVSPPPIRHKMRVWYGGCQPGGNVLEQMCAATGTDYASVDYRLPVPLSWHAALERHIPDWTKTGYKPICVYRPLVARPEWKGSIRRNADPSLYTALFALIRHNYYVISVADLEPNREWLVGPRLKADLEFHKGELGFEALAALFSHASLVYTSSGFAAVLAPAVGARCISIVGGYEPTSAHDSGKLFAPFLSIGPEKQCACFSSQCSKPCNLSFNLLDAASGINGFLGLDARDDIDYDDVYGPAEPIRSPIPFGSAQHLIQQQQRGLKA